LLSLSFLPVLVSGAKVRNWRKKLKGLKGKDPKLTRSGEGFGKGVTSSFNQKKRGRT